MLPAVISNALRENDLLARLGGDEFAVLLPHIRFEDALGVAEKIRKGVEGFSFTEGSRTLDVGISIGVALFDAGVSSERLLSRADEACYRAKALGRNAVSLWSATAS